MKDTDTFQANLDFMTREIAGEVVLVPTGNTARNFSGLASLNQTGLFLWKLLEQKRTLQQIIMTLAKEYDLTQEESRQDVTDFLNLAMSKGAILKC